MSLGAFLLWILLPLAVMHWWARRRPEVLRFQLTLDILIVAVCWPLLLGLDLNPVRILENHPPFRGWGWSERTASGGSASDVVLQLHPWWDLEQRRLTHGQLPYLAPEMGAGSPLVGSGQSGWLAPVMAPVWFLGPEAGSDVMAVWKLEGAGLGAFLLFSIGLRLTSGAAAVGGLAWAGAPFLVGWLLWPVGWNLAALPWVWWGVIRLLRPAAAPLVRRRVLLFGGLGGWFLGCGLNPETAVIVLGSGLVAGLILHPRRWRRLTASLVLALLSGALLTLPTLGIIAASSKLEALHAFQPNRVPLPLAMDLAALRQILNPIALGHPGLGTWSAPYPYPAGAGGVGGVVLALILMGGFLRRRRKLALTAWFLLAVCGLLAFRPPPLASLVGRIPPLSTMTLPRFLLVVPWALALLAALALEGLKHKKPRRLALVIVPLTVAVVGGWWGGWDVATWFLALIVPAAAALAFWLVRARQGLVPLLVGLELALLALGMNPAADPVDRLPSPPVLSRLVERATPGDRCVGLDGVLPANIAARYGLEDLDFFGPVRVKFLARLHALLGAQDPVLAGPLHRAPARLLGAWSVRWAMSPRGRELPGWEAVDAGDGVQVWRNPQWRPEVRLATTVATPSREEDGWKLLATDSPLLPDGVVVPPGSGADVTVSGDLEVSALKPERIEAIVASDGVQMLTVARCWLPGWTVRIDGRPASVVRANLAGLGVVVPPGRHAVEFVYRPWTTAGLR